MAGKKSKPAAANPGRLNVEQLAAQSKIQRGEACRKEVQAILAKYNCRIDLVQMLVNGQPVSWETRITPLDGPAPAQPAQT